MEFVCEFLGGPQCYSAFAWNHAREHAELNEHLYIDKANKKTMFFASVVNDYHRRHQTFMHSLSFKNIDEMAKEQMDFQHLTKRVENFEYVVHKPSFLPKKRPQDNNKQDYSIIKKRKLNNFTRKTNQNQQKFIDSINNEKHRPDLKLPENIKFRSDFYRKNRDDIDPVPHPYGSIKCNNWH